MAKLLVSLSYVILHTKVHSSICIIAIEVDAEEDLSVPVYGIFIWLGQVRDEMLRIVMASVFYTEIIDHETETYWVRSVFE